MSAEFVSFIAGCWLLAVCIIVMIEYYPRRWRRLSPPEMLTLGIFIGFAANGLNTAWWQILNTINLDFNILPPDTFTRIGRYADVVFKGGAALAGMIHLKAKRRMERDARG